ncbi:MULTISPECIES: sigma-54-dependent transcriptional regulator [Xanthomonas]|uniref:Sigma-54 dependent transcriptional regulator n=1 Tax=Xanthomonas cucurbitae TaxID=56453 RepID=A0A2S7DTP6_9XANT|nr:sigma-54 dependent transcriptional regulator [Xanthomonas cucurbitae]PPU77204.1 sigma-54-dependent Fis family transcriptional regulator [Xanthomonas cucurbitae]QHG88498.1 sigma-54-dependent Fis family transcriptional regulator [Xanthomonas cucurbitae]WDM68121.1 sigma-54 dependent transcriptional regulator [Xanthomonas cucurbitae]WDM71995.1 sigma-54 dependent transcriptional regulator [Xanthomonas cucurbitae]WDM75073.1 sigma-54 dependent transcriptional regulator [Xanthomonas cucurbitae]
MDRLSCAIIDDDVEFCDQVVELATDSGFRAKGIHTLGEASRWLDSNFPDLLVVDVGLPDGSGFDLIERLDPDHTPQIVVVSGDYAYETQGRAQQCGASEFLTKPFAPERLERVLGGLRDARQGNLGLIGNSECMALLRKDIVRVAPTDLNVLVTGETGTGKDLVVRAIHRVSGRRGRFVPVNCGAIPEDLLASQLFGHERGSFTGADRRHAGFLEQAAGGTLFLDEIGEMPKRLQVYLLRAIESRSFMRVGGNEEIPLNARVVAATHQHVQREQAVLREDLFYRLNEYPIQIPPLRERRGDARALGLRAIDELNVKYGTRKTPTKALLRYLTHHAWPGNVRELRSFIHYLYLRSDGDLLSAPETEHALPQAAEDGLLIPAGWTMRQAEDAMIQTALARTRFNKKAAARELGISVRTLHNRLSDKDA